MRIGDLPRNDARAALDYYKQAEHDGELGQEVCQILMMLQDDPSEYFALLADYVESKGKPST